MPGIRGRGGSDIRTPTLIRHYLAGLPPPDMMDGIQREWHLDTPGDADNRTTEGDYVAHIHQQVKALIKTTVKANGQPYQYPRRHSFGTMIYHLITLGLLELTGQTADPEERGAGQLGTVRGFKQRTWVRLTTGSNDRVEWQDPIGFLAQRYPSIRRESQPLPTAETAEAPAPRRRRRRAEEAVPTPAGTALDDRVDHLNIRREALIQKLLDASDNANRVEVFSAVHQEATRFIGDVRAVYPTEQFPAAQEGLDLLANCVRILGEQGREITQQRVAALRNCQSSARILAESITERLQPPSVVLASATSRQRRSAPEVEQPEIPPQPEVPTLDLPENFSQRSMPRLVRHLKALEALDPDLVREEVERLNQRVSDWLEAAQDAEAEEENKDTPNEDRLDRLTERIEFLEQLDNALGDEDLATSIFVAEG